MCCPGSARSFTTTVLATRSSVGDLDHDDGIGSARDHAAGEDAHRLPRPDLDPGGILSRPDLALELQGASRRGAVGRAHREAVHRGAIGRRDVAVRDDALGQREAERVLRRKLDGIERLNGVEEDLEGVCDFEHSTRIPLPCAR